MESHILLFDQIVFGKYPALFGCSIILYVADGRELANKIWRKKCVLSPKGGAARTKKTTCSQKRTIFSETITGATSTGATSTGATSTGATCTGATSNDTVVCMHCSKISTRPGKISTDWSARFCNSAMENWD